MIILTDDSSLTAHRLSDIADKTSGCRLTLACETGNLRDANNDAELLALTSGTHDTLHESLGHLVLDRTTVLSA